MPLHDDDLARNARALDFHWRVSDDLVAAAGLPKFSRSKINRAMASILAALALASDSDRPYVSYSRSRDFYAAQGRYEGTDYSYASVLQSVDELARLGLIEEIRSKPGAHLTHGMQSRVRASDRLVEILAEQPVEYLGSRCPLVLKDEDGTRIDYEDTPETRRLTREIGGLNRFLNSFSIDVSASASPDDWQRTTHHVRARKVKDGVETWVCARLTPQIDLYRVFSRGGFRQGGRIYGGFWEGLPKARRLELLINGEVCIEQDYASLHPRLLYGLRGERMPAEFDCYALPYYERWVGKLALNIALNAATLNAAAGALMEKGRQKKADGSPVWPYGWAETRRIIDQVIDHNPTIAGYIGSDAGVSLMAIDARMALDVLKACEKARLPALPVHDSFLAPEGRKDELKSIMSDVLEGTLDRISSFPTKGSRRDSMGETIQMIRYRETAPAEPVVTPAAVPVVTSPSEVVGVSPAVVETVLPEARVAFRPVVRPLPPRMAALPPVVAAPLPVAVEVSLPAPVTPPCPVAAPAGPVPSAPRVGLPAFLAALLPVVAPEAPPEPAVSHGPSLRFFPALGGLRVSVPPAEVDPEDVPPPVRPPAPPVVAAPPPEPILVSLAPASGMLPAALPRPPEPRTKEERIQLFGDIIAQSRAKRSLVELGHADARMAELRAMAKKERRVR
ncbi:hypothetical protein [Methylobacterium gregans]|jgi:hypothetical protein|uniref:Uncharacterized protein n=2 Tax=Methylobacterium gregans TaxID=374424 RepID=A0AA37MB76_9HYPH|nr:hypothetical protein [Methylobacterium gregans]MDQ0522404.1 hypothetical protein [Methylobacterium gregans]GJD79592.1 hypothetical protein NBEOAGPD_2821 [Methylobacterium gregans]GLS55149.1 hypothetical protein GCM10007886_33330 [Methylobacterium gregans]